MTEKELYRRRRRLQTDLAETRIRIRRYTLDPRLRDPEKREHLQRKADEAWEDWLQTREKYYSFGGPLTDRQVLEVEKDLLEVNRKADLIQRELITQRDFKAGWITVLLLVAALALLALVYLYTHGVRGLDFSAFEPLPEWGPLKYVEVAFWSAFGVLCWLLYLATYYLKRRDFDRWYGPWYVSTALRAPFLTVILMVVVLEFVEWYGEGTWISNYILEEGNKFYFIVFVSFCLGLMSEETSSIIRELAGAVVKFVRDGVGRVAERLTTTFAKIDTAGK